MTRSLTSSSTRPRAVRSENLIEANIAVADFPSGILALADSPLWEQDKIRCTVRADLSLDGHPAETCLVVGDRMVGAAGGAHDGSFQWIAGPFPVTSIDKVRGFGTVGSAFFQVRVNGVYLDLVRYTNSKREFFGRAALQIERLIAGNALQPEALTRRSEVICPTCGLPLPSRGVPCSQCNAGHGIFLRAFGLMRAYYPRLVALLAMMLAGVGLDLLPPLLTRTLVDRVLVPHEETHLLPYILGGLMVASLARNLLSIFIGRLSAVISTRITRELRERLEQKLVSLSVDYYNRHSVGSLMSRVLWDVEYFQGFVVQVSQGFLLNLMLVLGIGTMLFTMNWQLASLVIVPIPFVVVGTIYFWKHIHPIYYRVNESQSKMSQLLSGLLSGIRLVKSFGQEEEEHKRFQRSAATMRENRNLLETSVATFNPIMGFLFGLGGLIIWYAGGRQVLGDKITLGTLMAFFSYLGMFYGPVSALSMFSNWVTGFLSAGQRIFDVLDASVTVQDPESPVAVPRIRGEIEFKDVVFGYDPYHPILKGVSFRIQPGQFVGVVGKSGSGKTTLVNLINRFYDVQQGQVLVDGVDVRDMRQEDLHRDIALVLQEPFLFSATIAQNIAYGRPDATFADIVDASKAANAHDFITRRAGAYDTKLGEQGAGLSGGERQRISIARALLCDPRILILDEATSSVDTESEQEIQRALATLCKGRTTIAIAHRLSTLKNADWIYVVDQGRIAESGTHDQLMELGGIYHRLVKIQTELTRLEA